MWSPHTKLLDQVRPVEKMTTYCPKATPSGPGDPRGSRRAAELGLVLDAVSSTPVGELAESLEAGGSRFSLTHLLSRQHHTMPPSQPIHPGLSLHGFSG